ncbi:Esa1p-associated factor [Tulasnella sp. 403]|nr:Esa1p-associated factor [Tulasnella sp. 403]
MASTWTVGERVLCYHGPLIYEAKILKTETWDETTTKLGTIGQHFYVHYKGWKQTWDEWVPQNRLLKLNEQNLTMQKSLQHHWKPNTSRDKSMSQSGAPKDKEKDGGAPSTSTTGRRKEAGRKRGRDEDESSKKPDMKFDVPDVLKVVLVDDWEAVTKNNQLVVLPREPNVQQILKEFSDHCEKLGKLPAKDTVLPTLIVGLELYFDRSLGGLEPQVFQLDRFNPFAGNNLLYRFERGQYAEARRKYITGQHVIVGEEKMMSEVYGAEHLLRLLVNLPTMISQTTLDQESVSILKEYVIELLHFLVANKTRFFLAEYENAPSHYLTLMRS